MHEFAAGGGAASGHAIGSREARETLGSILSPAPPAPLAVQNRRAKTDAAAKGEAIES